MYFGPFNLRLVFAIAFVSLAAGCNRSGIPSYQLVPVSGTVKLNGAPLADADVQFIFNGARDDQYIGSTGKTDANGRYELVTNDQPGAVEGKFKVVVSKMTDPQGQAVKLDPDAGMDLEQLIQSGDAVESIPATYSNVDNTTLSAEVTAAKADGYDFELTN